MVKTLSQAQPVRVTIVVPTFPKLSETFIVSKFNGLLAKGYDVSVVCQKFDRDTWQLFHSLNSRPELLRRIHDTSCRGALLTGLKLVWQAMHATYHAPRMVIGVLKQAYDLYGNGCWRKFYPEVGVIYSRPDLVHFEFGAMAVGRLRHIRALGCRTVVSFRGYDLNFVGLEDPNLYREIWECADAIHCLGEDLWARAQRRGCPATKRHALIPPAIDAEFFRPSGSREPVLLGTTTRPIRLLSVGRLEWKKGYEYALAAVRLLCDKGLAVQYRIVGDGAYLEPVAFCIRQLGLSEVVTLEGSSAPAAVKNHMAWADMFLHAAVSEGFCNAVLEAQAMELPVVCSDADGLGENVADGQTGFVVPRRDPEAMAYKVAALAADPRLRAEMGSSGRARVATRFRLPDQIEAFHQLYSRVF